MAAQHITVSQMRRQQELWRSLHLNSEDTAQVEQKVEDIFFAFGHKINPSIETRAPLLEALKVVAEAPPIRDTDNNMDREEITLRLFFIFKICAPVWRRGYRMDGTKVAAERMEGVGEAERPVLRRPRGAQKAALLGGESRKISLPPQERHGSVKKPRPSSLTVVDSWCPTRIWNPSVTIVKASEPEKRKVLEPLGAVMKKRNRSDRMRMKYRWIDLMFLRWSDLVDDLSQTGWLETDQEIWWSSEPAAGVDVTSLQSQVKITSEEEFRRAVWGSMVNKFPDRCGPKQLGSRRLPKAPTPSFTIVIREKN